MIFLDMGLYLAVNTKGIKACPFCRTNFMSKCSKELGKVVF